jgi:hypothetical protein
LFAFFINILPRKNLSENTLWITSSKIAETINNIQIKEIKFDDFWMISNGILVGMNWLGFLLDYIWKSVAFIIYAYHWYSEINEDFGQVKNQIEII